MIGSERIWKNGESEGLVDVCGELCCFEREIVLKVLLFLLPLRCMSVFVMDAMYVSEPEMGQREALRIQKKVCD